MSVKSNKSYWVQLLFNITQTGPQGGRRFVQCGQRGRVSSDSDIPTFVDVMRSCDFSCFWAVSFM